jgi:hypothetical protein
MGDQSLMKKIYLSLFICMSIAHADLSVKQIEQMIEKIHLKREGVDLETLEKTKEPFIKVEKENNVTVFKVAEKIKKEDVKLVLHAIVAGKAYINDSWKKVGDTILGYTVKYIGKRGVVLRNGNTVKKLLIGKPKNTLIMLEERE